ncbi:MAG: 6-bladed beta-propeller [Tannerellaceae bacterium]|jgi:hypothetical protein|nr:6-bladed beta-propeller [Tannerellaceae bacterium]
MNKLFLIALSALFCFSCTVSNETEKYQRSRNNIIHVRDKVKEIAMEEPYISSLNRIHLMDRYFIINDIQSFDKYIHVFDKNTYKYITGIVNRGQGPNEIARIGLLSVDEPRRMLYVPDNGKYKILSYHLDSALTDSAYVPGLKMAMVEAIFPDYIQFINDSMAICRIIQPIGNNNFQPTTGKLNIHTGQITLMPYEHPKITGRKRFSVEVSLEHRLYVEYHHYRDLITVCDFDGNLIYNIYGPAWGKERSRRHEYYSTVVFCGDKIYATYLGGIGIDREKMKGIYPTQILVFDLQGNYIQTLDVGLHIEDLCYDSENNRLLLSFDDEIQFGYLELD